MLLEHPEPESLASLVDGARAGDGDALEAIMRKFNRRLFRIARAILRDDLEAEDVVQESYIQAFQHIKDLRVGNSLGAWLCRITTNTALSRRRQVKSRESFVDALKNDAVYQLATAFGVGVELMTPERNLALDEIRRLVESEVDRLPEGFREVFVMRCLEEMSVAETAEILGIPDETVKTRYHRARMRLQRALRRHASEAMLEAFPFAGARCDRIVRVVLGRLGLG